MSIAELPEPQRKQLSAVLQAVKDFEASFVRSMHSGEDLQIRLQVVVHDSRLKSVKLFRERNYDIDAPD